MNRLKKQKIHYIKSLLILCNVFFIQIMVGQQRFSTAGFFAVENSPRKVLDFNPGWRFYKGDVAKAESIDFDDSDWEGANLPHGLEILGENGSGCRNYQGIAWYRKKFDVALNNGKVFLYFEAVMGHAEVWVNGQKVVEHFGGYLPFAVDITKAIHSNGKANIVAVKANNANSTQYPPGRRQNGLDFAYLGGIYRDTYLIQTNPVHVTLTELSKTVAGGGIFAATLDVNGNKAKMEVRTEISNESAENQDIVIKTSLEDANFKEIKTITQNVALKSGEIKQLSKKFEVKGVHLWHPDDPYLHFLRTEVISKGKIVDVMRTRIGIRLFEMRGAEGFFVNKKYIGKKLIGVNRHQDYVYVGNALPNSGQWRDVKLLREGGSNVIRAGHYPQDPAFYDACDELGMLTSTANPGWHFFNFKDKIFEERLYQDTRNLVRRDRHIASILFWETALNETPSQPDHAMNNMHKAAHEEYPFPGMFTVTDHQEAKKGGFDIYYHGNDKNVNSFNREFGDGGEVDSWYSHNAVTRVKMEWGEKALLKQSLVQAKYLSDRFSKPKVKLGGAMWAGIDHQRGYHPDPFWGGHLNVFRLPRYTYYLYKSQYAPDFKLKGIETGPMIFNTNQLTQISPSDVVIYSNCEEIRLTWQGKVIGTQKPSKDDKFKHLPHPPFVFKDAFDFKGIKLKKKNKTKFEMVAEGLIKGKVVTTDTKIYALRSEKLELKVADEGLSPIADGSDFVPVRASIVDINGVRKVLASEEVFFEVEGPAKVIGGNANNANPVRTTLGIATALIKSTGKAGMVKVTAYSKGLKSASISYEVFPSKIAPLYDKEYMEKSKEVQSNLVIIEQKQEVNLPKNVSKLQKELKQLRLDAVGKDQEIMDLRSKLGN